MSLRPFRTARKPGVLLCGLLLACLGGGAACSKSQAEVDAGINQFIQDLLVKRTPQQRAIEALQTENADERRKRIRDVLKSKESRSEWAVKVFASVAKIDTDPQVRCMAIKGLRQSADRRVAEPLLMILNHKDFPKQVAPPQPEVRWDATEVLAFLSDLGEIPEEHRAWAQRTLVRLVTDDPDRNVRICAAQGLRNFPDPDVLTALVRALEDDDFAIRYAAEGSLERLTGQRFDYDPDAWREWIGNVEDPFAVFAESAPEAPPIESPAPPVAEATSQ